MSRYAVDPGELREIAGLAGTRADEARAALVELTCAADQVLGRAWRSPAAASFAAGWHEWVDGARAALDALADMADAVGLAGEGYRETEDRVRVAISGGRR